jgi:succinate dehydrogenase hydrophobic anchor subunit
MKWVYKVIKNQKDKLPHSEFISISATGIATSLLSFALVLFLFFSIKEAEYKECKKNEKKDKFSGVLHQKWVKGMLDRIIQIKSH